MYTYLQIESERAPWTAARKLVSLLQRVVYAAILLRHVVYDVWVFVWVCVGMPASWPARWPRCCGVRGDAVILLRHVVVTYNEERKAAAGPQHNL